MQSAETTVVSLWRSCAQEPGREGLRTRSEMKDHALHCCDQKGAL